MELSTLNFAIPVLLVMGLALFLFGMSQLESGISALGYNTFKRWLSNSTASPAGSAITGMVTTAILQSSSMVSLLVLAFASAGVLPLFNAIGVMLGANLGSTITGWMIATIGFKLSLQVFALPMMAGGGLMQLTSSRFSVLRPPGLALFGLGLVIFGLDIMKGAVEDLPRHWDLAMLKGHGLWLYFVAGTVIAALIQSSAVTIMITLAALHAGLLDLNAGAAIAIGADLGTTSTTMLGSIGGHFIKRQLALAHFLFNLIVDTAAFFLLLPMLPILLGWLGINDPLYGLVAFHSVFNLLGMLVFLPLLKPYSHWIGTFFLAGEDVERPLAGLSTAVVDAALVATERVLCDIRLNSTVLNLHAFHLLPEQLQVSGNLQRGLEACLGRHMGQEQRYSHIKQQEADLLAFSFDLQEQPLSAEQVSQLERQIRETRALVYSSKTLNDIRANLVDLRHSQQTEVSDWYKAHRNFVKNTYRRYLTLATDGAWSATQRESLTNLLNDNEARYRDANNQVNILASGDVVSGIELSTMLNVNREVHHALKNLLLSINN